MENPTNLNGRITALIDGKSCKYKTCSLRTLEEAKKIYKHLNYIGSSKILLIDGNKKVQKVVRHFFN